jgi:hypothetical protein
VIQRLLGVERELVTVEGLGVEVEADWDQLQTPETYLGYGRGERFASADAVAADERRVYELPRRLPVNHWSLAGEWTIGREIAPSFVVLRFRLSRAALGGRRASRSS